MSMAELLYAITVGLTLAAVAFLIGFPDWATSLSYVAGVLAALLVRSQAAGAIAPTSEILRM